jgi:hypothetical protein
MLRHTTMYCTAAPYHVGLNIIKHYVINIKYYNRVCVFAPFTCHTNCIYFAPHYMYTVNCIACTNLVNGDIPKFWYVGPHVQCPPFSSDSKQTWMQSTFLYKSPIPNFTKLLLDLYLTFPFLLRLTQGHIAQFSIKNIHKIPVSGIRGVTCGKTCRQTSRRY